MIFVTRSKVCGWLMTSSMAIISCGVHGAVAEPWDLWVTRAHKKNESLSDLEIHDPLSCVLNNPTQMVAQHVCRNFRFMCRNSSIECAIIVDFVVDKDNTEMSSATQLRGKLAWHLLCNIIRSLGCSVVLWWSLFNPSHSNMRKDCFGDFLHPRL